MNSKEKAALYALSESPALLEKVTIKRDIFTGKSRQMLNEIMRQFNESQSFSYDVAADKLGMKISELYGLYDGCYRFKEDRLAFILREIEREWLKRKIASAVTKLTSKELKTGDMDDSLMTTIRRLYGQLDNLDSGGQQFTDYRKIESRKVFWLWPGRIPLGMITLVAGHPGVGKSFFVAWLAAELSRGGTLPGPGSKTKIKPCSTIMISADDDPGQTIKPRLEGNAADFAKIINLDDPIEFSLDAIGSLDRQLDKNPDIRMIVIDHLNAFLGATDYFRDPDVIQKILPLKKMAEDRAVTILAVVHFNKREDSELITRIGGSMAFAKIPRSILGISYDTRFASEDTKDVRLLSSLKMNLARKPETLAFKISDNLKIEFNDKPVQADAEAIFSRESREQKQRWLYAESWLLSYMEEHPECLSMEARKAAEEEGIARTTLYRAKTKLDSQGFTESLETGFGKDKKSYWKLIPREGGFKRQ